MSPFPWGTVLQEQTAPAWVPHRVTNPARKPAPEWAPLSPQVHRSCQEPAPAWSSCGVTAFFGSIHLLWRGVLHTLLVDMWSTMDLHGLQGGNLPHHGLHHGLTGNLCFSAWSTSFPTFLTDLGIYRVISLKCSHSFIPLQMVLGRFFSFLKYVITEALPPLLMGLALTSGGSVLEPAGIDSIDRT